MLTIHHLGNSRSQRILWLLEELGVDYEIKRYERDKSTSLAPPALLAIHPLGKSPVITDGELTVAESGAIVEYLVSKYDDGRLLPPDGSSERRAYTYWLHYAEGTFAPLMIISLIMGRIDSWAGNSGERKTEFRDRAPRACSRVKPPRVIQSLVSLGATNIQLRRQWENMCHRM